MIPEKKCIEFLANMSGHPMKDCYEILGVEQDATYFLKFPITDC